MALSGSDYSSLILPKAGGGGKAPAKPAAKLPRANPVKQMVAQTTSPLKLRAAARAAAPKPAQGGGFNPVATIEAAPKALGAIASDVPKEIKGGGAVEKGLGKLASIEKQGYTNIFGSKGISGEVGKLAGNTASGLINAPAQALPTIYNAGKAAYEAKMGKPQALHSVEKSFEKESTAAHLLKGEWHEALKAAERNPPAAVGELAGGASALDRFAGEGAKLLGSPELKAKLAPADAGATTVSRTPKQLLGNATQPLQPYDKGLVKRLVQSKNKPEVRPEGLKGVQLARTLQKHYDQTEASLLRINRNNRTDVINARMGAVHTGKMSRTIPGIDAVSHFARGILADPKVLNKDGEPVYRDQLSQLVEHHERPVKGETLPQKAVRQENLLHTQRLLEDPDFEKNPHAAYQAAQKTAADKAKLEPELIKHGVYTKDQMRAAKVIPAFRFHFRGQDPLIDMESPKAFSVADGKGGRRSLSTEQVYKELAKRGVKEDQLAFHTTKPFENPNAAYNSTPAVPARAGMRSSKGSLTGTAFMNGQYDPTYDALVRQHLQDQKIVDEARAVDYKNSQYTLTREHIAKLVEEKLGELPKDDRARAQEAIAELRKPGSKWFDSKGPGSAGQKALEAKQLVEGLHANIKLTPARIAHPYAAKAYRDAHLQDDLNERLDPAAEGRTPRYPQGDDLHNREAGEVGLVHERVAKQEKAYERDTGSAFRNLISKPASWWRRANIAYSVRHVPGLLQEVGIRALVNKIGPKSYLRGRKAYTEAMKGAESKPFEAAQLRGMVGGTQAQLAEDLSRHVNANQLWGTFPGYAASKFQAASENKIMGPPLKATQTAMHVYSKLTTSILHAQRKVLERPQELAGLGKHLNDEAKRITGKSLPVIKSMQGVQAQVAKGLLDQKALDAAGRSLKEFWGDWQATSPSMKHAMVISPFFKWYTNSLKFIYHTLPAHHPIKTGLMLAAESATAELRRAEGQGYSKGLHLGPQQLAEGQQGSVPGGPGFRVGQEYYTPGGAVSGGLETALGSVFPYASDAWAILHGTNPLSGKTLENAQHEQITDANKRIGLALLSGLESFFPPYRIAKQLTEKGEPEKEDPFGKALGIPPSLWKVIRPVRTEKERTQGGVPRETGGSSAIPTVNLPTVAVPTVNLPTINIR